MPPTISVGPGRSAAHKRRRDSRGGGIAVDESSSMITRPTGAAQCWPPLRDRAKPRSVLILSMPLPRPESCRGVPVDRAAVWSCWNPDSRRGWDAPPPAARRAPPTRPAAGACAAWQGPAAPPRADSRCTRLRLTSQPSSPSNACARRYPHRGRSLEIFCSLARNAAPAGDFMAHRLADASLFSDSEQALKHQNFCPTNDSGATHPFAIACASTLGRPAPSTSAISTPYATPNVKT